MINKEIKRSKNSIKKKVNKALREKVKKLKLYGEKNGFKGFIAEIYIRNNKVIVESKDETVREILSNEINEAIKDKGGLWLEFSEETEKMEYIGVQFWKISDPNFIEAIRDSCFVQVRGFDEFGNPLPGFCMKLKDAGYKFIPDKSIIIEE